MPGFSFVYDRKRNAVRHEAALAAALSALLHDERYKTRVVSKGDGHYLASTGYPEYPIESFEAGHVVIHAEGCFYGSTRESRAATLSELAHFVFDPGEDGTRVLEWLLRTDGDFVLFLFDTHSGDIVVLNDLFGRLPVYWYRTEDTLVVSRELRFVARLMNRLRFDRMAIAQYLLLGYPVGGRTLLEGVNRMAPAAWTRIDARDATIRLARLHWPNYQTKRRESAGVEENALDLFRLFCDACAARDGADVHHVLSLSGGFESRAVAAGFQHAGARVRAVTYLDHVGNAAADVPIARRVAALFKIPWELFTLTAPTRRDVLKLLRLKNGMNPLGMSFLLPFLEEVRSRYEAPIRFLAGTIGDHILPDLRPPATIATLDGLVEYLISQDRKFALGAVAALTGFAPEEIANDLQQLIASFPERDLRQKYVHFVLSERDLRWHTEGLDRNQCFFWTTNPFQAPAFFNAAMECPDEQKSLHGLYRAFFSRLSPSAAAIAHAGIGAPIASSALRHAGRVLALIREHPEAGRILKERLNPTVGYDADSTIVRSLRHQLRNVDALSEYMSVAELSRTVEKSAGHSREAFDHLFTVTSIIEDLTTGTSVLERPI